MKTRNWLLLMSLLSPLAQAKDDTVTIPVTLYNHNDQPFGTGYDTRAQAFSGYCVANHDTGTPRPTPVIDISDGAISLKFEKDESKVADKLGISANGRYQTGVTETSASAEFMNEASKNDFKLTYTFVAEHLDLQKWIDDTATKLAPTPGFAKYVGNSDKWFARCGDQFVSGRISGARLFVNVSLSFVSKLERDRFNLKFQMKSDMADFKSELEKNHSEFSSGNRMTVQAVQRGGDTAMLGKIFCPKLKPIDPKTPAKGDAPAAPAPGDNVDTECASNARMVADCGFGDITKCVGLIANAVAYGNSTDGDNFAAQIKEHKNFSVMQLQTTPYVAYGDPFVRPPTDQHDKNFKIVRGQVESLFALEYKNWVFSDNLYNGQAPRLSDGEKSKMETLRNELFKKMEAISDTIDVCYDEDEKKCSESVVAVKASTGFAKNPTLDRDQYKAILALTAPETFVQYCDIADDTNRAVQRTVETLATVASSAKDAPALNQGDRCANLAIWLEAQKTLVIPAAADPRNPGVADLGPIAVLHNLQELTLTGQSIRDVTPLQALKGLKKLTLDNNLIEDVTPLKELPNLERLSIQNNRVASVDALAPMESHLQMIDARGNRDGLSCPLSSPTKCRILSFADYADISSAYTKCDEILHPATVVIDDTHVLATGGRSATDRSSRIQVVDNQGCRVLPKGLAVPRLGHTMTMTPNGILIIGGGTNRIERVDSKSLEPAAMPAPLAETVANHTATLLPDGRVLVVGGAQYAENDATMSRPLGLSGLVQLVGADGKVETIGRLAVPRAEHTATLLSDGRVLILGGFSSNDMIDIAEIIDPARRMVVTLPETLPFGRSGHAAALLENGHVLVAGGNRWAMVKATGKKDEAKLVKALQPVDQVLDFDPSTAKFRVVDEKLSPAIAKPQAVTTSDHRVLLIGGNVETQRTLDGTPVMTASSQIQVYDPKTEAFYQVKPMLNRRLGFTATAIGQNSVLIFGGSPSWTYTKDANDKESIVQDPFTSATELLVYRPR